MTRRSALAASKRALVLPARATPVGDSPEDFAAFVREDIKRWAPIVKASGATPN